MAKRHGGEPSRWQNVQGAKRLGCEVTKGQNVLLPVWASARTSSAHSSNRTEQAMSQSCSLGLDVSVSRQTRDVTNVLVSSRSQQSVGRSRSRSRSRLRLKAKRLGLGPQRLVYEWTFNFPVSFIFIQNKHERYLLFIHSLVLYIFPFR